MIGGLPGVICGAGLAACHRGGTLLVLPICFDILAVELFVSSSIDLQFLVLNFIRPTCHLDVCCLSGEGRQDGWLRIRDERGVTTIEFHLDVDSAGLLPPLSYSLARNLPTRPSCKYN